MEGESNQDSEFKAGSSPGVWTEWSLKNRLQVWFISDSCWRWNIPPLSAGRQTERRKRKTELHVRRAGYLYWTSASVSTLSHILAVSEKNDTWSEQTLKSWGTKSTPIISNQASEEISSLVYCSTCSAWLRVFRIYVTGIYWLYPVIIKFVCKANILITVRYNTRLELRCLLLMVIVIILFTHLNHCILWTQRERFQTERRTLNPSCCTFLLLQICLHPFTSLVIPFLCCSQTNAFTFLKIWLQLLSHLFFFLSSPCSSRVKTLRGVCECKLCHVRTWTTCTPTLWAAWSPWLPSVCLSLSQ